MRIMIAGFWLMATAFPVGIIFAAEIPAQNAAPATLPHTLKIVHFDVGLGDSTLIIYETPELKPPEPTRWTILIDGGSRAMARRIVIPGVIGEHIQELDYVIA